MRRLLFVLVLISGVSSAVQALALRPRGKKEVAEKPVYATGMDWFSNNLRQPGKTPIRN